MTTDDLSELLSREYGLTALNEPLTLNQAITLLQIAIDKMECINTELININKRTKLLFDTEQGE